MNYNNDLETYIVYRILRGEASKKNKDFISLFGIDIFRNKKLEEFTKITSFNDFGLSEDFTPNNYVAYNLLDGLSKTYGVKISLARFKNSKKRLIITKGLSAYDGIQCHTPSPETINKIIKENEKYYSLSEVKIKEYFENIVSTAKAAINNKWLIDLSKSTIFFNPINNFYLNGETFKNCYKELVEKILGDISFNIKSPDNYSTAKSILDKYLDDFINGDLRTDDGVNVYSFSASLEIFNKEISQFYNNFKRKQIYINFASQFLKKYDPKELRILDVLLAIERLGLIKITKLFYTKHELAGEILLTEKYISTLEMGDNSTAKENNLIKTITCVESTNNLSTKYKVIVNADYDKPIEGDKNKYFWKNLFNVAKNGFLSLADSEGDFYDYANSKNNKIIKAGYKKTQILKIDNGNIIPNIKIGVISEKAYKTSLNKKLKT